MLFKNFFVNVVYNVGKKNIILVLGVEIFIKMIINYIYKNIINYARLLR